MVKNTSRKRNLNRNTTPQESDLLLDRSLFNSIQEGYLLAELVKGKTSDDLDFRYIDINPAAERILGITRENVIGKTARAIIPNVSEKLIKTYAKVVRTGKSFHHEIYEQHLNQYHENFVFRPSKGHLAVLFWDISDRKKTEFALEMTAQSLSRERERLDIALRAGQMGVYEWQVDSEEVWWSPEVYSVYGVNPNNFTPTVKAFSGLIHPEDREELWEKTQESLSKQKAFEYEYRIIRPDGQVCWIANRSYVSVNKKGNVERITGIAIDITERKRAESRLQLLVSSIDDHLVSYNTKWQYTFVNDAAARTLGKKREELLGKSIWQLFPDAVGNQYYQELHEAFRTQQPIRSQHYYRPFNKWFENHIYPSKDGVTVFATDITARKNAEEALHQHEALLQGFYDTSPVFMGVTEVEAGDVFHLYDNPATCRFFGVPPGSTAGKWSLRDLSGDPKTVKMWIKYYKISEKTKSPQHFEHEYQSSQGKRWLSVTVSALGKGSFGRTRFCYVAEDATERKLAEAALKKSEQQKDEFIGIASHELKTPVTSLKAYAQILQHQFIKKNDLKSADMLDKMNRQIDKLTHLISDLLDVTKVEQGKLKYQEEAFDFNLLVTEVVEEIQRMSSTHKIVVKLGKAGTIYGDRDRIGQVITNFLTNAVKFSPQADKILVITSAAKQKITDKMFVSLSVQDFGVGLSEKNKKKVFERFYRVEEDRNNTYPGLGLGLYISSEIIKRHGGTIGVDSVPGKGSVFHFTLPILTGFPKK